MSKSIFYLKRSWFLSLLLTQRIKENSKRSNEFEPHQQQQQQTAVVNSKAEHFIWDFNPFWMFCSANCQQYRCKHFRLFTLLQLDSALLFLNWCAEVKGNETEKFMRETLCWDSGKMSVNSAEQEWKWQQHNFEFRPPRLFGYAVVLRSNNNLCFWLSPATVRSFNANIYVDDDDEERDGKFHQH